MSLLGALACVALACAKGGSGTATAPATVGPVAGTSALAAPAVMASGMLSALGLYRITVDSLQLTAASELLATRDAAQNDDLYLLAINEFLNPRSFEITDVTATPTTIDVGYRIVHPFPAPADPMGTPNARTNRSDLAIAGMVLFLADVPSSANNTYFSDRIANTALIANADAYFAPGDLLELSTTANTFPYLQLVDEAVASTGSRVEASNDGDVTGNFGSDGWTRSEFGPANDQWTGYGVLHQGQSSARTVSLRKSAMGSATSLDIAIVAKYNDPRGGANSQEKRANRLPPATADASRYAYRMPHGALDVGRMSFAGQTGAFLANEISAATFRVHLEDWDARATETAAADLSEDSAFDTVGAGESGVPTLDVCIPGILGDATVVASMNTLVDDDSAEGGDAAPDSGRPGDALYFSQLITKTAGTGQLAGNYIGMFRATDPESGLVVPLDLDLQPLTVGPEPVTYQAFTTGLTTLGNTAPTANVSLVSSDPLLSGTMPSLLIAGISDSESDPVDVRVDWGLGGGFVTIASGLTSPYPNQTPTGPQNNNADLVPDTLNLTIRVQDAGGFTDYPISYQLGPNRPPQVSGTPALANNALATPASFVMNVGTSTAIDPEGDAISYTIVNNRNANVMSFGAFPNAANSTPIANPPHVSATFTVYANDANHAGIAGTVYPVVNGVVNMSNMGSWVWVPPSLTAVREVAYDVLVDASQNVWVTGRWGTFTPGVDFGGGLRPNYAQGAPMFLVKLDGATGTYLLDRVWQSNSGAGDDSRPFGLCMDLEGNIYVAQTFASSLVIAGLGGGATNQTAVGPGSTEELAILKFSPSGTFLGLVRSSDSAGIRDNDPSSDSSGGSNIGLGQQSFLCDRFTGGIFTILSTTGTATQQYGSTSYTPGPANGPAILLRWETSAFSASGTGSATWVAPLCGSAGGGTVVPMCLAQAPNGDFAVGGAFQSAAVDFGDGVVSSLGTQWDAFLVRRTAAGAFIPGSSKVWGSPDLASYDYISHVQMDNTGVYVAGAFGFNGTNSDFTLGPPMATMNSGSNNNGFLGKLSLAGVPIWQRQLGTAARDAHPNGGLVLRANELVVQGLTMDSNLLGWGYPTSLLPNSMAHVVAKYEANTGANSFWGYYFPGNGGFRYPCGLDQTQNGDLVQGFFNGVGGTMDLDPGPGTQTRTLSSMDFGVMRTYGTSGGFTP